MILELWEFADQLRQTPGRTAGELIHNKGRASPAPEQILRQLALGYALTEVAERINACEPASKRAAGS